LGVEGLRLLVERWRLLEPPPLEVPTEAGTWSPQDPALEAIGQGGLTVSPLQMARVAAALAAEGMMPAPRLALQVADPRGGWRLLDPTGEARQVLSPEVAQALLDTWVPYSPEVAGHLGAAVAGEDRPPHAWFLGVAPTDAPRYAVVVLLEHAEEPQRAAEVGQGMLEAAVGKGTD
jgi:peptidoglycan glycosyltransferase